MSAWGQRLALSVGLAAGLIACLSACATPSAGAGPLPVFEARISHSFIAKQDPSRNFPGIIGHGRRETLGVSVVPGEREILLRMGAPTGCLADAPEFWSEYNRLSEMIPPLRIRLDRSNGRLVELNAAQVNRAILRTAPEAERLLGLCDFDNDEERAEARAEFEKSRDRRANVNDELAFPLHALFLAIRATDRFTKWDARDEEGSCPKVAGPVLTKLRFKNSVRCTRSLEAADPEDPLVEGHIGTVHITGYDAGPDPNTVSAYVQISRTDEVLAASEREERETAPVAPNHFPRARRRVRGVPARLRDACFPCSFSPPVRSADRPQF